MPSLVGQTLGHYELTALVAEGALCQLYLARETGTDREAALKVVYPTDADSDAFLERSQRVAQGVAALRHPGIIELLGSGVSELMGVRAAYLASPFIEGTSLEQELARLSAAGRSMEPLAALRLLQSLAAALDYAHHRGLRHLNLKPSNVLLRADGEPLITDFGLAEIVGPQRLLAACPEPARPYLAPELAAAAAPDGRADVYSLGQIAAHLLAGARADSPGLDTILSRATNADPAQRYRTAGELLAALQAALPGAAATPAAAATAPQEEAQPETATPASGQTPPPPPPREGIRQFLVQILAVLTAVMALLDKSLHAVNLLRNPLIGLAVVAVGVGAMVLSAGYVLARPHTFNRKQRTLAGVGLAVTLLAAAGWGGWTVYEMTRPPKGLIVLIAGFEQAPGAKSVDYARRIESGLSQALKDLKVEGVYVERVNEVYSTGDARDKAAARKASVVIYGWYDDAGVNPSFELVRSPQQFAPIVKQATVGLASLDRLELRVDKELREMSYIAAATIGLVYYADGQDDRALPFFEAALGSVPDETVLMGKDAILLYRAACQFNRRAFAEAVASLEQAVALNPDFYEAHQNLAIVYNANCDVAGALDEINEALRLRPDSADAHHLRGLLLSADGRNEEAVAALAEAARLAPEDSSIQLSLAGVYGQLGRQEEAEAAYQLAADATAPAESDSAADIQAIVARADGLLGQGDLDGALALYRQAISRGQELGLRPDRLAWTYRSLGMAYWEAESWEEMIAAYSEATKLDPGLHSDYSTLGIAYQRLGNSDQAVAAFEAAVALQPCNANTRDLLAGAYEAQGRVDDALAQYQTSVEYDPDDFSAWNAIGIILEAQGRSEEARAAYEKAAAGARVWLEKSPNDAGVAYMLGAILYLLEDYEGAREAAQQAVSLSPDAASHHLLAGALLSLGDYAAAAAEFEEVLELEPQQASSLLGRAMSYENLGHTNEAIAAYRALIAVDPAYYNQLALARLYEAKGEFGAAADSYEAALAGAPADNPDDGTMRIALAGALSKACRPEEAIAKLGPPPAEDPTITLQYQATLAALQEADGDTVAAAATYAELVQAYPDLAPAHYLLAWFDYREGRLKEAEASMRQATELAPAWAFAWSGLGQILDVQGQLDEAEEAYQTALEAMPDDSSAWLGLAAIALQRDDAQAALEFAQQALGHEPGYSAVLPDPTNGMLVSSHVYLGWAYGHLGEVEEADRHLAEALRLAQSAAAAMPDYSRATHQLGVVLLAAGRTDEAEPYLDAAIRCDASMAAARTRAAERVRLLAPAG